MAAHGRLLTVIVAKVWEQINLCRICEVLLLIQSCAIVHIVTRNELLSGLSFASHMVVDVGCVLRVRG